MALADDWTRRAHRYVDRRRSAENRDAAGLRGLVAPESGSLSKAGIGTIFVQGSDGGGGGKQKTKTNQADIGSGS